MLPTATPVVLRRSPLLATLLVLGSCARAQPPVSSVAPAPGPTAAAPVDVELLDAGDEPRAPLRYRIGAGQSEAVVIELSSEIKLAIGDMSRPPLRGPLVRVTLDVTARSATPLVELDGEIVKVEVLEEPSIAPGVVAAVRSDLAPLAGAAWTAAFTDRGVLERLALPTPAEANPQLGTTLEQLRDGLRRLLVPLPETAVGKDARWRVSRRTTVATARVEETATFTLGAPANGKRPIAVALTLAAGPQNLALAGIPPGSTLALAEFEGKGRGQIEIELARIAQPSAVTWSATGRGTARAANEPPNPMTLTIDSSITVRRR